jgi:hypothetical protein
LTWIKERTKQLREENPDWVFYYTRKVSKYNGDRIVKGGVKRRKCGGHGYNGGDGFKEI